MPFREDLLVANAVLSEMSARPLDWKGALLRAALSPSPGPHPSPSGCYSTFQNPATGGTPVPEALSALSPARPSRPLAVRFRYDTVCSKPASVSHP